MTLDPNSSTPAAPPPAPQFVEIKFLGSAREYFRIWAVNLCLTLFTLGIFSAWAKVRKKRYFYSHTTFDNTPFQYLAQPWPILKGRLIAVALFLTWYLSSHFFTVFMPLVVVAAFVLAPWVLVRSAAFNARYSAFRNLTFSFRAGYRDAVATLYAWGLIPCVLLGGFILWQWHNPGLFVFAMAAFAFYIPFWLARLKRFLVGNTVYGGQTGVLSITGGNFYFIYFKAGLVVMGLTMLFGFLTFMFAKIANDNSAVSAKIFPLMSLATIYLSYLFAYAYSHAKTGNLVWNNTRLGPLRFESQLTARGLAFLYLSNGVAILFSCGLLIPWAVVRTFRYRAECLRAVMQDNWTVFRGSEKSAVHAAGAEVGEIFDLDFSL